MALNISFWEARRILCLQAFWDASFDLCGKQPALQHGAKVSLLTLPSCLQAPCYGKKGFVAMIHSKHGKYSKGIFQIYICLHISVYVYMQLLNSDSSKKNISPVYAQTYNKEKPFRRKQNTILSREEGV